MPPSYLLFVTGGARSGKSRYAEQRAAATQAEVTYLASAQAFDEEMRQRLARHRAERPKGWVTVEEPLALPQAASQVTSPTLLIDCLSLWVSNMLLSKWSEQAVLNATDDLMAAARRRGGHTIMVSNEVGFGIVPDNALARQYRDWLGWVNQRAAAQSDEAQLLVSGLGVRLK